MNVRAFRSDDETPDKGSYSRQIRNRFLAEALVLPYFASFKWRVTSGVPIMPDDLPFLACYLGDENMIPRGERSAGPLEFIVTARLNWSCMIAESDKEEAERRLDGAYVALLEGLLRNPSLVNFGDTTDYDTGIATEYNARIDGFQRHDKRIRWGTPFHNNETPVAELQYEMTVSYDRVFSPILLHDLEEINIETSFPVHRTPEERERIQQIRQQLILNPAAPAPRKDNAHG
ncbi:MAG: hypothetical protein WCB99_03805 [Candidatus Cybelea sp.]